MKKNKLTRSQVRVQFWRQLGNCFREEREKRGRIIQQIYVAAELPRGEIENLELGQSESIGKAFKLAAYYGKKIVVTLER